MSGFRVDKCWKMLVNHGPCWCFPAAVSAHESPSRALCAREASIRSAWHPAQLGMAWVNTYPKETSLVSATFRRCSTILSQKYGHYKANQGVSICGCASFSLNGARVIRGPGVVSLSRGLLGWGFDFGTSSTDRPPSL